LRWQVIEFTAENRAQQSQRETRPPWNVRVLADGRKIECGETESFRNLPFVTFDRSSTVRQVIVFTAENRAKREAKRNAPVTTHVGAAATRMSLLKAPRLVAGTIINAFCDVKNGLSLKASVFSNLGRVLASIIGRIKLRHLPFSRIWGGVT
jgi:hypothetical protein